MNLFPASLSIQSIFITTLTLIISGCGSGDGAQQKSRGPIKFAVEVAEVRSRNVDFTIHAVGSVEAFEIVPVTARVQGVVEKVNFREGDAVNEGQPLVEIEPERYRLDLVQAEAQFEKSKAALSEAKSGLQRRVDITEKQPGMISSEELEDWQTRVRTIEADSAFTRSQWDVAKLNSRDARVPAPVDGIIQSRPVITGQYLQPGAVIATIVRRDPLLLRFNIPEQDAKRIANDMQVIFKVRGDTNTYSSIVTAISESADPVTRMITVTAEINDPARDKLRPGSFAEVNVQLGESAELPVIPQTAIRPSEKGFLAYIVKDSTAHERVLTLGMRSADGLVEVQSGIGEGDTIVVRGAEALSEGAMVRINKVSEILSDTTRTDTTKVIAS